jgi:3-oxoacyl-[acyl-carrier-protein] synthase-3
MISVCPIEPGDQPWVVRRLENSFAGITVARKGILIDASILPGFVASDGGRLVGLLTYSAASVASSMLCSGAASRILLVGVEALTTIVDPDDRSTSVFFGDGAGAVVLERGDGTSGFVDHLLGSDGQMAPLLRAGHPGTNQKVRQNGREVFRFAVRILPELVERLVSRNRVSWDDVQYVIPHQANLRIIEAAARKLELPRSRMVVNIERYGNTSAASIPICYPDIYDDLEPEKYIITVGFGAGLTWAANLYRV